VREFRKNLRELQRQVDKAQAEREARWKKREHRLRRDAARLLDLLEKAVAPPAGKASKKKAVRKESTRKKA
jgi:hypothetical protein